MPAKRDRRVIVQVVNGLERAGAERMSVDLARQLDPGEWDVHVVVVRDGVLREYVEDAGLSLYKTGHGFDKTALFALVKMAIYFRRIKPDVVHTHLLGSDIIGRLAALAAGVPIIVSTQHDMLPRPWYYTLYKRLSARSAAATVACSSKVASYCRTVLRIPGPRLHVIDNGIDVSMFEPAAHPMQTPVTFGAIGSLTPVKGHRYLVEAFSRVLERHPDSRLVIAGAGIEHDALEQLIGDLGLQGSVELRGVVNDVPAFLSEVDVFVHPSLSEGLPMALLEAMAAARPCITTNISVLPEVLGCPDSGTCVEPSDPESLASAMIRLADEPAVAEEMGRLAQERARERYSLERSVDAYAHLYRELIAATKHGRSGLVPRERPWWRWTRTLLQTGLIGTVLFFIGRALMTGLRDAQFEGLHVSVPLLLQSIVLVGSYYLAFTGGLALLLRANGHRVTFRDTFKVSFMANVAKYVPGGVWPIVGRVALASRIGISRQSALVLSIVESAVSVAGAAAVVASAILFVPDVAGLYPPLLAIAIAVVIPISLHPRFFGRLVSLVAGALRIQSEPIGMGYLQTLGIVLYYAGTWLVAGAAFRMLVSSIVGDPGPGWLAYSAYYAFASVVGLLVLFAPGGVGAREGAVLLALTAPLGAPVAAVISIVARLWSSVVELCLSAIAIVIPYSRSGADAGPDEVRVDES